MIVETISAEGRFNAYLVVEENSKEAVIIDPFIEESKIEPLILKHSAKVKYVILTHCKEDPGNNSVSSVPYFVRQGIEVLLHEADDDNLSLGSRDSFKQPVHGGEAFSLGGKPIRLIYTPGYTNGSMSIYLEGHLFTGALPFKKVALPSDPFSFMTKEDVYKGYQRLAKLGDETKVYPGNPALPQEQTLGSLKNEFPVLKPASVQEFVQAVKV
jgi:glyoxylase-like metal-dependent hydrolase (beta-lactamase superfamily II)